MSQKPSVPKTQRPNPIESQTAEKTALEKVKTCTEMNKDKPNKMGDAPAEHERDLVLTHKEAQGGSPDDNAACGEEDIGAGLEFLVTKDNHHR